MSLVLRIGRLPGCVDTVTFLLLLYMIYRSLKTRPYIRNSSLLRKPYFVRLTSSRSFIASTIKPRGPHTVTQTCQRLVVPPPPRRRLPAQESLPTPQPLCYTILPRSGIHAHVGGAARCVGIRCRVVYQDILVGSAYGVMIRRRPKQSRLEGYPHSEIWAGPPSVASTCSCC